MQTQKIKIWKKIVLGVVGVVTAFTMTFASNFAVENRENVAYAEVTCPDGTTKAEDLDKCPAAAQKDTLTSTDTGKEQVSQIITKFIVFEQWINSFMWPVFMMIGGLINNELIFSNGMDQRLYDIWVQIRNLVNIVFVIILVGIALYSVLGISSESSQYSIKTMLPKLIVGIIAVNFSFLGI